MIISLLSIFPQAVIITFTFYIISLILKGIYTIGDYSLYTGLAGQAMGSITGVISLLGMVYDNEMRITNYKKFLLLKPKVISSGKLIPPNMPAIEFKNVSFRYPGKRNYVLENLSFKILPGESVALVGLNGSGKREYQYAKLR